jgi:archaellum biogenesis ATPase FlaH
MTETLEQPRGLQRFPSGIAGLDRILGGGLFIGGNYLVMGPPGAGKTILGNQLCFHHIATGGRAIYLSLLAETSSRLLAALEPFTFYTPDPVGDALTYFSGYGVLEQDGLEGLLKLIRTETRNRRATLLVLDGTAVLEGVSSQQDWMRFLLQPVCLRRNHPLHHRLADAAATQHGSFARTDHRRGADRTGHAHLRHAYRPRTAGA